MQEEKNMHFLTTLAPARSPYLHDLIRLVQAIWDEIAADPARLQLTEAHKDELDSRLRDDDANPTDGIPWETIREEARSRSRS
jgi:putative addiction module component (TIGR02574 family)